MKIDQAFKKLKSPLRQMNKDILSILKSEELSVFDVMVEYSILNDRMTTPTQHINACLKELYDYNYLKRREVGKVPNNYYLYSYNHEYIDKLNLKLQSFNSYKRRCNYCEYIEIYKFNLN